MLEEAKRQLTESQRETDPSDMFVVATVASCRAYILPGRWSFLSLIPSRSRSVKLNPSPLNLKSSLSLFSNSFLKFKSRELIFQ